MERLISNREVNTEKHRPLLCSSSECCQLGNILHNNEEVRQQLRLINLNFVYRSELSVKKTKFFISFRNQMKSVSHRWEFCEYLSSQKCFVIHCFDCKLFLCLFGVNILWSLFISLKNNRANISRGFLNRIMFINAKIIKCYSFYE